MYRKNSSIIRSLQHLLKDRDLAGLLISAAFKAICIRANLREGDTFRIRFLSACMFQMAATQVKYYWKSMKIYKASN